jgi:multidrug efflux pump subunit AcrA (membrane-fusion protein)
VSLIKSNLNTLSSKCPVEITFEQNYPEVISGMFARLRIVVNRRNTFIIPPECLKKIEGKPAVYLALNNVAVLRFVEIGHQRTDAVEIKSGLSEDEAVISFASEELKDGIRIKIIESK